jgi:hypothetical protein
MAEISAFNNRFTGEPKEGEKIVLKVIPLDDLLLHAPDAKALCAYLLYKEYMRKETKRVKDLEAVTRLKEKDDEHKRWDLAAMRKIIADHPATGIDSRKLGRR